MNVTTSDHEKRIVIRPQRRLDLSVQRAFRNAYRYTERGAYEFVVDLRSVDYLDSAALGMLLLLWEHARRKVTLECNNGTVLRILLIAGFDRQFTIHH